MRFHPTLQPLAFTKHWKCFLNYHQRTSSIRCFSVLWFFWPPTVHYNHSLMNYARVTDMKVRAETERHTWPTLYLLDPLYTCLSAGCAISICCLICKPRGFWSRVRSSTKPNPHTTSAVSATCPLSPTCTLQNLKRYRKVLLSYIIVILYIYDYIICSFYTLQQANAPFAIMISPFVSCESVKRSKYNVHSQNETRKWTQKNPWPMYISVIFVHVLSGQFW
jgi:hypothetical protein